MEPHRPQSRLPMLRLKPHSKPTIFSRVVPPLRYRTPSNRLKRRVKTRQSQPSLLPPKVLSSSTLRPPVARRCFRRARVLLLPLLPLLAVLDCLARNPPPLAICLHPSLTRLKPRLPASLRNKSRKPLLRTHSEVCFPPNLQTNQPNRRSRPRLLRSLHLHRLGVRPSHLAFFSHLPLQFSRILLPKTGSIQMLLSQVSDWKP